MSEPADQYVAFVSYSHKDAAWAKWVQREIERYRLPAAFAKEKGLPKRLGKVFRDREELSTGQNLGDHLTAALDHSENLIVICSPNAVQSKWVSKEIEYFKNLGRGDRIFALLVEGGAESLSEPLLTDVHGNALEPLAADPRKEADGKRLAKLKLIAGMLGTNLDQLAQRERARRQQQLFTYVGVANVFLVAVGAALFQAEQKARERELGIENVMSMTDFVKRTRQYYDKGALKYVSDEFSEYLERFDDQELTTNQKAAKADALRVVGEATYDLGDVEKSLKAYNESRELYYSASTARPDDLDLAIETAFSDFYVGVTHFYEGNLASAKQPLERYAEQILELYKDNPGNPLLLKESIDAPTTVLVLHSNSSQVMNSEISDAISVASDSVATAINSAPEDPALYHAADSTMHYAAHAHMKSCEVTNALPYRQRAVEYARKAVEFDPRNRDYKTNLANALFAFAQMHLLANDGTTALSFYDEAASVQRELISQDPENQYLKERLLATQLERFATSVFAPETFDSPAEKAIKSEILSDENRENAKTANLENYRDYYLLLSAIMRNDAVEASSLLYSLHTRHQPQTATAAQLSLLSAVTKLTANLLELPVIEKYELSESVSRGENCNDRLVDWANAVLAGDANLASTLLSQSHELGQKGMVLNFFAERVDVQSPSPDSE